MVPFATDGKHTAPLGVPTYGFSPLRLDPDERFLERFHGVDERVARSTPCAGGCPSSTTSSAASAADAGVALLGLGPSAVPDHDLLVAGRADVQLAAGPGALRVVVGRVVMLRPCARAAPRRRRVPVLQAVERLAT